jgi:membrane dipeptidase
MNRLGILIDLSHVGDRTTLEAIETSQMPVAFTHANSRSYYDQKRNKTDEALRLLASRGGVVGATAIRTFLRRGLDSTLDDYVLAIDALVEIVGIDHVGIGTDYTQDQPEGFWRYISSQQGTRFPSSFADESARYHEMDLYPDGLETPDKLHNLVGPLAQRGYSEADIAKLLGGNWLRLFGQVWPGQHPIC